jgi:hypothetical protein
MGFFQFGVEYTPTCEKGRRPLMAIRVRVGVSVRLRVWVKVTVRVKVRIRVQPPKITNSYLS